MKYQARNNYIVNWPEYPLLRISICFIIGIFISDNYSFSLEYTSMLLFGLLSISMFIGLFYEHTKFIINILSCSILLIGFSFGLLRGNLEKQANHSFHYKKFAKDNNILIGRISAELKQKKRYSTTLEVEQINGRNCRGKLLLYFSSSDSILGYEKGDIISIRGKILAFKDNSNPHSFNYKDHLKYKGVNAQMFLKEDSHRLIDKDGLNVLESKAYDIRKWALSIFEKRLTNKDQLATASAMVLGYKAHLSKDLYNSFAETGAVHILAVSGLHVGIICMIFIVFFNRFNSDRILFKIIKLGTLLFIVWLYALVTGASPAVLRASVMFSLILVGRLWFKGVNIYNILAFSALLLLMYDPYLLFQLSFQFSYLALISIIFFQPKIERLYDTKHWISTKFWQLTSVSIAAQILVFPISIFYFHKFPTYFILSGVAAVFLATFILGMGLMLLCLDKIPVVGDIVTTLYSGLLDFFIRIISAIQSLPFNNIEGVYFSKSSVVILYVMIGTFMFLLSLVPRSYKDVINKKLIQRRIGKWILASCVLILMWNNIRFDYRIKNHNRLVVYDISKATMMDVFIGDQVLTLQSDSIDQLKVEFASKPYRIYNGSPQEIEIKKGKSFDFRKVEYNGNGILRFNNNLVVLAKEFQNEARVPCNSDVLLVINSSELNPSKFLNFHHTKQVVLDNSIDFRIKKKWRKECDIRMIPIHDIYMDGVFEVD